MFKANKESEGLFKGVWMAYSILTLHLVLVAALGCLVLFFSGVVQYMMWIFLIGSGFTAFSGYRFYKRMKEEKKNLEEMMDSPLFRGKSLEISFLGGIASVKVGGMPSAPVLPAAEGARIYQFPQLEDSASIRVRELSELASLFEKKLITLDEYNQTKDQLFNRTISL